jgi:hypothetical protein
VAWDDYWHYCYLDSGQDPCQWYLEQTTPAGPTLSHQLTIGGNMKEQEKEKKPHLFVPDNLVPRVFALGNEVVFLIRFLCL